MDLLAPEDPDGVGPYRFLRRLGGGGMGRVFLGESADGTRAAVKIVHSHLAHDPEFRSRFAQEVAAARRVAGAYTAEVIDAEPEAAVAWLATRYVAGPTLEQAVSASGSLPGPTVWRVASGLVDALWAIHTAGLVHRDLKPGNVLLGEDGPRVIDFGIARAVDHSALTHSGMIVGTPAYMAPEQIERAESGPAADVFALGSVLVYAATGKEPFGRGPAGTVLYRIVHGDPDLGELDGPLKEFVTACLTKNPTARPDLATLRRRIVDQLAAAPAPRQWPDAVTGLIPQYPMPGAATRAPGIPAQREAADAPPLKIPSPRSQSNRSGRVPGAGPAAVNTPVPPPVSTPPNGRPPMTPPPALHPATSNLVPPYAPPRVPPPPTRRQRRGLVWGIVAVATALVLVAVGVATAVIRLRADDSEPDRPAPSTVAAPVCGKSIAIVGALHDPEDARQGVGTPTDAYRGAAAAITHHNQLKPDCLINVIPRDTGGDPARARTAAQQVAADPAVLGVVLTDPDDEVMAAGGTYEAAKVPFFAARATNSDFSSYGWTHFHRTIHSDADQIATLQDYLRGTGHTRLFVVTDSQAYSRRLATVIRSTFGSDVVGTAPLYADTISDVLTQIRSSGANAVYLAGAFYADEGKLRKALGTGFDVVASAKLCLGGFTDAAGPTAPGTHGTCLVRSILTLPPAMTAAFSVDPTIGADPDWYTAEGYLGAEILVRALAAGKGDRAAVEAFADAFRGDATVANIAFRPDGDLRDTPAPIYVYRQGPGWSPTP